MVVGSIKDLSSTYYNPGAVACLIDQGLLITTGAFELTSFNFHSADKERIDISDNRLNKAPGMFAMRFPFDIEGNEIASLLQEKGVVDSTTFAPALLVLGYCILVHVALI
jgi:hypothetical protein